MLKKRCIREDDFERGLKMKTIFKNTFYVLSVLMLYTQVVAQADTLQIEKFSTPIKMANRISQPINVTFASSGRWKLLVETMDPLVRNQENPNYSIPITRVELAELGGRVISNLDVGKILEVKTGIIPGVNSVNIALNALTSEADRAGNYVADLKFTLINLDNNTTTEGIYNFRFVEDEIAKIDFSTNVVNLKLDKEKILTKGASQNLLSPVGLYVTSNKDWKLYVRNLSSIKDTNLTYFYRVLGGDSSVNCNLTNDYVLLSDIPVLIASGKSTIDAGMNCLTKKMVNIDYKIKGPEGQFIKAGTKTTQLEYRLETEN